MACLQLYRKLLSLVTFLRVHSNSNEISYFPCQNTYPNLKTTCHIKLKFFLWTKLIKKLLVAKSIISVTPPLNDIVIIKLRYSIKPKHGRYVKGYGFLFFGKNICKSVIGKYIQKLPDGAKKSTTDAIKTASKRVVQKRVEATVDLFSNEIDDKIKCVL